MAMEYVVASQFSELQWSFCQTRVWVPGGGQCTAHQTSPQSAQMTTEHHRPPTIYHYHVCLGHPRSPTLQKSIHYNSQPAATPEEQLWRAGGGGGAYVVRRRARYCRYPISPSAQQAERIASLRSQRISPLLTFSGLRFSSLRPCDFEKRSTPSAPDLTVAFYN